MCRDLVCIWLSEEGSFPPHPRGIQPNTSNMGWITLTVW